MATLKNRNDLQAEAAANLPDNTTQAISPQDVRQMAENLAESNFNKITDGPLVGLKPYNTGVIYETGQGANYLGNLYFANKTTTLGAFVAADWDLFASNVSDLNDLSDVATGLPGTPTIVDDTKLLFYDHGTSKFITDDIITAGTVVINAKKASAGTIAKGKPVYLVGFDSDLHTVEEANAGAVGTMPVIGFAAEDMDATNAKKITTFGKLTGLDTSAFSLGADLYISTTTGTLTATRPTGAGSFIQRVAKVLKSAASGGQLFIFNTARAAGLPNLAQNNLWVGDANGQPQAVNKSTITPTDAQIEIGYNNQVPEVTQAEAEAGTVTTVKRWTPQRVKQAIDALASGGDSIYTADGTVSTNRSVNFSNKFLTFDNLQVFDLDAGSTSAFVMRINAGSNSISNASKIELYETSSYIGYAKSLIFRARKNEGSIKQLAYTNSTHGFYLTSGYSATTDFTNINRRFEIGNNLTFFQNTDLVIAPNVTTGTPVLIGTEDISLQGHTIIKGGGTTTGTTLALYDNDTTPSKTWEWLDNGNVNLGVDTVITLNNTLKIESGQTYLDNGSFNPLVINRKSSGVSGVGIDFNAYNSSNVETNFARIVQVATDATAGSEDGGLWFRTMIAGTLRTPVILDNREFLIDASFTDNAFRVKYGGTDCLKVTTSRQTYIESGSFNPLVINGKYSGVQGVGIDFNAYNSSNVETNFARIVQVATDATAGSEDGALWLRVSDNGTITTKIKINSDSIDIEDTLDMKNNRILNAVINPNVQEAANSATFTINADEQTDGVLTAMSASTTIAAPTGTPVQCQDLVFRFKDDGTARALTWNAVFRAIGVTLPTTTTASKLLYVGCKYNSTDSKWDVIAVQEEA